MIAWDALALALGWMVGASALITVLVLALIVVAGVHQAVTVTAREWVISIGHHADVVDVGDAVDVVDAAPPGAAPSDVAAAPVEQSVGEPLRRAA